MLGVSLGTILPLRVDISYGLDVLGRTGVLIAS